MRNGIKRLRLLFIYGRIGFLDARTKVLEFRRDLNIKRAERLDNRAARLMERASMLDARARDILRGL